MSHAHMVYVCMIRITEMLASLYAHSKISEYIENERNTVICYVCSGNRPKIINSVFSTL